MRLYPLLSASLMMCVSARADVTLSAKSVIYAGESPELTVRGADPGEAIRMHTLQRWSRWQAGEGGAWTQRPVIMHAWAEFRADPQGSIDLATATPTAGSYAAPDPLGLVWSGYRRGDARLGNGIPDGVSGFEPSHAGRIYVFCERAGRVAARTEVTLADAPPGTIEERVRAAGVVGAFAAPAGATGLGTVIVLHGSEGGDLDACASVARCFAAKGFAALALVWYAPAWKGVPDVPSVGTRIDLGVLERARAWLQGRKECDVRRIALVGSSKGAELALLGASRYAWVTSVVGIVPSDVVWEGFGWEASPEQRDSTWSVDGVPLAYVPLIPFDEKDVGRWKSNTQRYLASRAQTPAERVREAMIPVERSDARMLLLAGERDEVWASADMARAIEARMKAHAKGDRVEVVVYPMAGHQLWGTGVFPVWLYADADDNLDGMREGRDVRATGEAAARAWTRTIGFLRSTLGDQ
jgi:dienelactone hydrolase